MGISVKWTFENESIFYAGEPLIVYITLSCTAAEKRPVATPPRPSSLFSTVLGMFSPSSATSPASSPPAPKKLTVEAENSRKKTLLFLPKSQKISYKSTKVPELDQEEGLQGETVKIQLCNSQDAIVEALKTPLSIVTNGSASSPKNARNASASSNESIASLNSAANGSHAVGLNTIPNGNHTGGRPPFPRLSSEASHAEFRVSQDSQVAETEKSSTKLALQGTEEIAWIFAQMTGNFKVDDTFVKTDQFRSLENKIAYRIDGSAGSGIVGGGALAASTTNLGSPSQPRQRKALEAYPIYGTPPSIIASNLSLKPGESVSFKYEILLPPVIPPSFSGKCSRFSYRLILGIQRANVNLKCSLIKIPVRIFNRTNDDGSRHSYEILNPIMMTVDESITEVCGNDFKTNEKLSSPKRNKDQPLSSTGSESRLPSLLNIQQICSHSQRVSYDICKNNEHIAKLILLRGAYRLGDSVAGLLYFDKSVVPTIETSVYLETVETVDPRFSLQSKALINSFSLKLHSEVHKFTLHTKRMGFVLALPLDGCPDFQTTASNSLDLTLAGYSWHLRFEFITGVGGDLFTTFKAGDEGNFVESYANSFISSDSFDCIIPIKVYGVRKGLRKWISQTYEIIT